MNYNYDLLKKRIKKMYGSNEAFAKEAHVDTRCFYRKMNNEISLKQDDMNLWGRLLQIPETEYAEYFLKIRRMEDMKYGAEGNGS